VNAQPHQLPTAHPTDHPFKLVTRCASCLLIEHKSEQLRPSPILAELLPKLAVLWFELTRQQPASCWIDIGSLRALGTMANEPDRLNERKRSKITIIDIARHAIHNRLCMFTAKRHCATIDH
jgi:hypothetical protein